jgi:hypothetical protein
MMMNKRGVVALGLMLVLPAVAGAAVCQVTGMKVLVKSQGLDGTLSVPGLTLPVTIDGSGNFSIDFSAFPQTSFTIVGVMSDLSFPPSALFTGTIDGAGNVNVKAVQMNFAVNLGPPLPPITLDSTPDITTGISPVTIGPADSGTDYVTEGTPLDFTTGAVSIQGQTVVPNPPVLGTAVSTGLELDCIISPPPAASGLPAGPKLVKASGKGKTSQSGDTLKLNASFTQGAHAVDPATQDLFLRIRDAQGNDALLVRVPSGAMTAKGKKLSVTDTDGTKIRVLTGKNSSATPTGHMIVKKAKKGFTVALSEQGLDLSSLTTATGEVGVLIGGLTTEKTVKVIRKSTKISLK